MPTPADLDPQLAELGDRIRRALEAAGLPDADPGFERPKQADHGDWATTLALRLAKEAKKAPRDIAQALVDNLELPDVVESAEIAGPGFVNFRFAPAYWEGIVRRVLAEGEAYGRHRDPAAERINVEFVSANPTGPLHAGHGRWAAAGDALAEVLDWAGHDVAREYYVNDAGEQVRTFGESLLVVRTGGELGDDHYKGDYVVEIAAELADEHGEDLFAGDDRAALVTTLGRLGTDRMRAHIEATLHDMGVDFETWFSERSLHEGGALEATVEDLRAGGHVYETDSAVFLRTTDFGDDKDRVLVRSDGRPTYFAADCAYMRDKKARGYERLVFILGADHHGYIGRLKAVAQALGYDADHIEVIIGQLVKLVRSGEPVKMSKRAGDFVTLEEIVEEVGSDAARYHFLRQSTDTQVTFDLDVVVQRSMDNPVYYVQYAHARIASLVREADERGYAHGPAEDANLARLVEPAELELVKRMSEWPEVVIAAADLRAVQRVARYAEDLAAAFHRFYTDCRVLVDDTELGAARYWLAVAAKRVLENVLAVLRVSAPERM